MQALTGDPKADAYLIRLATRARELLDEQFVGAYLLNSGARGDYLPGRSDLDVALIVASALDEATQHGLARALRHRALPCPAPRLELVAYRRDIAAAPGARPPFEINLNTGPAIADHVTFDLADEPAHWFVLDLGAASEAARAIWGPEPDGIFGAVPRRAVLDALRASDAWHRTHEPIAPNRVLNACRAWCWAATSHWVSKSAAAAWAINAGGDEGLIHLALARRAGERDDPLPLDPIDRLASALASAIEEASMRDGD